jgi:hypothetical protein
MTGFRYAPPSDQDIREKRAVTRTARGIDNYWNYLVRHLDGATHLPGSGV